MLKKDTPDYTKAKIINRYNRNYRLIKDLKQKHKEWYNKNKDRIIREKTETSLLRLQRNTPQKNCVISILQTF